MRQKKNVYYLEVVNDTGKNLRYGQKGGGTMATKAGALARQRDIKRQGVESVLYEGTVSWVEISSTVEPDEDKGELL